MTYSNIVQDIIVVLVTYAPPLIVFGWFFERMHRSRLLLFIIGVFYLGISVFTQNLFPFILVVIDIWYLKNEGWDYEIYNFSIGKVKFFKAMKYSFFSYFVTVLVSGLTSIVFVLNNIPIKEQEVVTWMAGMPLYKFLLAIPIAVIFAPVLEEFVFRWFFYKKVFGRRFGNKISAIVSSIIFASAHYNLMAFPIILWIGLYNCYLMEKKGYWYAVINHMFFNSVSVILMFLSKVNQ
ncbi:MAG: lysostaphin resistance A-like protein [Solirubrobacterales bacterium]